MCSKRALGLAVSQTRSADHLCFSIYTTPCADCWSSCVTALQVHVTDFTEWSEQDIKVRTVQSLLRLSTSQRPTHGHHMMARQASSPLLGCQTAVAVGRHSLTAAVKTTTTAIRMASWCPPWLCPPLLWLLTSCSLCPDATQLQASSVSCNNRDSRETPGCPGRCCGRRSANTRQAQPRRPPSPWLPQRNRARCAGWPCLACTIWQPAWCSGDTLP